MNIYLAFPSKFNKRMGQFFQIIVGLIKQSGHKISLELPWFEKTKGIRNGNIKDFFEKDLDSIDSSDVIIADITLPSSGVGYQIAYAVSQKKPVLCIYHKAMTKGISKLIRSISSDMVELVAYEESDLEKIISSYLDRVNVYNLSKFNFLISPKIRNYLTWVEQHKHQSKSQFLRNAISSRVIDQDKEYQEFLKKNAKK